MTSDEINIAIVDDEALILSLLSEFFEKQEGFNITYTSESGEEFIQDLKTVGSSIDILILDLRLKGISGVDVLEHVKNQQLKFKVIVISSHYKRAFMGFMLKTGASAFLPKGIRPADLVDIIKEVKKNEFYFLPDQLEVIREQVATNTPKPLLSVKEGFTEREIDVLKLICRQKTAKEIGDSLFIAKRTVEGYKESLFRKSETKNVAGLVIYAIQNNLVHIDEIVLDKIIN